MRVIVDEIRDLTEKVRAFTLRPATGTGLPPFSAGSHITITVVLPGGVIAKRKYSILSSPAQSSFYEIAVLREPDGTGGSRYMHTRVHVGQSLDISEPRNQFPLSITGSHHILLAGGIGITPLLSMLHVLHEKAVSFEIHYAARTQADHVFKERILALAGQKAHFYHSEGSGKRSMPLEDICTNIEAGTRIYACGPARFYDALRNLVDAGNISSDALRYESFGVHQESNGKESFAVLSGTGETILIKDNQTILSALTESGINITYDCMRGECGICAVDYKNGEITHRDNCLSDEERNHRVCICVSQIKSDKIVLAI